MLLTIHHNKEVTIMEGKIIKVFNAADQIQAEMIHDHLKEHGIESMSKQPSTGEYMSITMGYSVYGTDIYVKEEQKAKAEALINELLYDEGDPSDDEDIKLPWWQNKRIVAGYFLGFFVLAILLSIIL